MADLRELVGIPSVSGQAQHAADCRRCAAWLAGRLHRAGMPHVQIIPTPRHPVVLAEWRAPGRRATALFYAHYDVQPAGEPAAWRSPPFQLSREAGVVYGRGVSDDKGPLLAQITALESGLKSGGLPVNVICLYDGEEEIGSPNMPQVLDELGSRLQVNAILVTDTCRKKSGRPTLTIGLRGSLAFMLEANRSGGDLHSGRFGGVAIEPLRELCHLLAGLHDRRGRVLLPGFYASGHRAGAGNGSNGMAITQPALIFNGLQAGSLEMGVIPGRARARLDFRLVPGQDPQTIEEMFRQWVAQVGKTLSPGIHLRLHRLGAAAPFVAEPSDPGLRAAERACRRVFGVPAVRLRSGGSIRVAELLARKLGVTPALVGLSLPDDANHAPNEKFQLSGLELGKRLVLTFLDEVGRDC